MRRKIVIIGPAFPYRGGIADFNNALAKTYADKGDDVVLYSFSLQYPSLLFPGKTQYEENKKSIGLNIKTIINSINPFNWIRVARKINNENPDYVIIRYWLPFMAPCLGTISRLLNSNIKILAITDNIIPHEQRIGDYMLTKYFVKSCDAFLSLSKSVLNDLSKFTNTTYKKFIPHPIYDIFGEKVAKSIALRQLGLDVNGRYLLFFGFIRKYKGLDILLEAMADNRVRNLGVKLIVAGEFYEDEQLYLDMIKQLSISDDIIFRNNFIPSDEVKYYFCAADMITQTYRTATQSGVTQIAYHFERPMLVTDVGGLAEIVPDNKVGYVTSQNPVDIAEAICKFYQYDKEKEFTVNTIQEKKRFSWLAFIDGIEELIDTTIK